MSIRTIRLLVVAAILVACAATVWADSTEPGPPWFRPDSTVRKAAICDGVTNDGQPRHPSQKLTTRQRVIVLWLDVDSHGQSVPYTVVWTRNGKKVFEKSWTQNWPGWRLLTIVPANSSQHVPGPYQVEVREGQLAVVRIPFVVTETR